jgi:hypothetical protein
MYGEAVGRMTLVLCVFLWQLCEKSWRKPLALHNISRLILALDIGCRKWNNAKKQLKNLYLHFVDGAIVDIARELFYNPIFDSWKAKKRL